MKSLSFTILVLFLLSGCTFGRPSAAQGSAIFSIPFDFGQPENEASRKDEFAEEVMELEAEMIIEKKMQKIKESE
ncbi:hypothetical protein ACFL2J_00680 [Candidatus Omnitrophota bacterium]